MTSPPPQPDRPPPCEQEASPTNRQSHRRRYALSLDLDEGLPPLEVERRYCDAQRGGELSRRVCSFYAAQIKDRATHEQLGQPNLELYVWTRLRTSADQFRRYVAVGRALPELPEIDRRFERGELSFSAVRRLASVATPETERAWAEWAVGKPYKEVSRHVARHEKGQLPTDPDKRRIHDVSTPFRAALTPWQHELAETVRAQAEARLGGTLTQRDLLIYALVRSLEPGTAVTPAAAELDPENHGPTVKRVERDVQTSESLREHIHTRDEHRCRACGGDERLTVHHIIFRSRGGRTAAENLVLLCEDCHSLVHANLLILRGTASDLILLNRHGQPVYDPAPLTDPSEATSRGEAAAAGTALFGAAIGASEEASRTATARLEPEPGTARDEVAAGVKPPGPVGGELPQGWLVRAPSSLSLADWRRLGHLFRWDKGRGGLRFSPGRPRDRVTPAALTPPHSDSPCPTGAETRGPSALQNLVGLTQTRKSLSVALEASRQRGRQFGHTLLAGPAGVGKSSLARAIANELGTRLHHLMAPAVQDPELLIRQLLSLSPGEVVFLDEIHRLPTRAGEILYDALSQNELNLPLACDGWEQRALRIELPPFTLLGATTEPDDLPEPLLSRFVYHEQLGFYGAAELAELLRITANTQGVEVAEEAVGLLAAAARDTPRDALALLAVARDEAHSRGVARIDRGTARESLRRIGRDPSGLDTWGRAYLQTLREAPGGSLGLSNLASGLGLSRRTVQRVVEPFLIRRGWVRITARGRSVSTEPRTRAVRAA